MIFLCRSTGTKVATFTLEPLVLKALSVLLTGEEFVGTHSLDLDFPQSVELKHFK